MFMGKISVIIVLNLGGFLVAPAFAKEQTSTSTGVKSKTVQTKKVEKPQKVTIGTILSAEWGDLPHCEFKEKATGKLLDLYAEVELCQSLKGKEITVTYIEDSIFVEGAGQNIPILKVINFK